MELKPTDRVLLLTMPSLDEVRGIATQVSEGLVVAIPEGDAVYEARASLRDYPNVMIIPADPEGSIPWRDEFFTTVYAPHADQPTREMLRDENGGYRRHLLKAVAQRVDVTSKDELRISGCKVELLRTLAANNGVESASLDVLTHARVWRALQDSNLRPFA